MSVINKTESFSHKAYNLVGRDKKLSGKPNNVDNCSKGNKLV